MIDRFIGRPTLFADFIYLFNLNLFLSRHDLQTGQYILIFYIGLNVFLLPFTIIVVDEIEIL